MAIKACVEKHMKNTEEISQSSALFYGHAVLLIKSDKGQPFPIRLFLISQMFPGEGKIQTSSHIGNYLFKLDF